MFDKIKFAQILKNINETYDSQRDFAKKSEINRTYLSQYMNMKLEAPPKPKILEKLANASNGITTYNELMKICGYVFVTELTSSSYGIDPKYWTMIFGSAQKIQLTQKGSTFFSSFFDKMLKESQKSKDGVFIVNFDPALIIPKTDEAKEFTEYIKIFSFIICSLISTNIMNITEMEKNQLLSDIQELLNNTPVLVETNEQHTDFRYAEYNGINTEGLTEDDIEEINRFVEFIKNKKKNNQK